MSPLVLGEMKELFFNTLTADRMHPVRDCENLLFPIQMQSPETPKAFSQFFVPFLEATSNLKHFERKDDRHN